MSNAVRFLYICECGHGGCDAPILYSRTEAARANRCGFPKYRPHLELWAYKRKTEHMRDV